MHVAANISTADDDPEIPTQNPEAVPEVVSDVQTIPETPSPPPSVSDAEVTSSSQESQSEESSSREQSVEPDSTTDENPASAKEVQSADGEQEVDVNVSNEAVGIETGTEHHDDDTPEPVSAEQDHQDALKKEDTHECSLGAAQAEVK